MIQSGFRSKRIWNVKIFFKAIGSIIKWLLNSILTRLIRI